MAEDNARPHIVQEQPTGVGPRLRAAREGAGLSLAQMSDRTKIPARMLQLMEAGDFAALPARTYATGFTRSYSRALGLDEREFVAAVRAELGLHRQPEPRVVQAFEPGDPNRVPSARFAWLAAVAALVVLAAGLVLWRTWFAPAVSLPALQPEPTAAVAPVIVPAVPVAPPGAVAVPQPPAIGQPLSVPDPRAMAPGARPTQAAAAPSAPAAAPAQPAAGPAPAAASTASE